MSPSAQHRRPLKARSSQWAKQAASWLTNSRITPNQISVASLVFAVAGAVLLLCSARPVALMGCALCIQARLLCNLLDGMVAVEGGKHSAFGPLYNELPDRLADTVLMVALGYAIEQPWLGWFSALMAVLTAYVRAVGGSLGLPQDFRGPMAKQHRMAVMTAGCLLGAIEWPVLGTHGALTGAAFIIAFGAAATCVLRTLAIARQLQPR